MGVPDRDPLSQLSLPPGFRFYPTDEELLVQYLCRKVAGHHFNLQIIADIDLYKFDPWVLPSKAIFGEKEWYFFSPRDRKYPNGSRPNRVAGSGYWKATGTDKIITTEGRKVGIKKSLVFYVGKAPKGTKTNWIMHEYRLLDSSRKNGSIKLDDWVLCRIYKKNSSAQKVIPNVSTNEYTQYSNGSSSNSNSSSSHIDDVLESLPEIDDSCFVLPRVNDEKQLNNFHHNNLTAGNFVDWTNPAVMNSVTEFVDSGNQTIMNYGNDICVPTLKEEEVQSKTQRIGDSGFSQQGGLNMNEFSHGFSNNVDLDGFRYPVHPVGFGFRQ